MSGKKNHFKSAVIFTSWAMVLVYGLFLYLWYLTLNKIGIEFFLLLALFVSSLAVAMRREWGRKAIVYISSITFIFNAFDAIFLTRGLSAVTFLLGIICLIGMLLYRTETIKRFFVLGFDIPSWKILLVDDDKTFLRLMAVSFEKHGLPITTAQSGEECLKVVEEMIPDLIVLDVILPGIKGRDVCMQLKENEKTQDIPVIFLTIQDSEDDIAAGREAGAAAHLTKPVDFQRLYLEIKKILGTN